MAEGALGRAMAMRGGMLLGGEQERDLESGRHQRRSSGEIFDAIHLRAVDASAGA